MIRKRPNHLPARMSQLRSKSAGRCIALARAALIPLTLLPFTVNAGSGVYTHGYGIKSLGFAGIGFVLAEDSYTLSSNPAGAVDMGQRVDFGLDYESPHPGARIDDNAAGPDDRYASSARDFFVPQFGAVKPVSERMSIGATAFFAGFGTDYKRSPFERFGGDPRITLNLAQAGLSGALGYRVAPRQSVGLALNLSYQILAVKGADVFAQLSQDPEHFSDQGKDGSLGLGFTLGWRGELTPGLLGALSYRSKTWAQRFDEYAGLLPDRGNFEFPANFGAGLSWELVPGWTTAFEFQRVFYTSELAMGNEFRGVPGRSPLGSKDGPGFGWENQNLYKLGLARQWSERLILRGGYIYGTANIPGSQTVFGTLGPSFGQRHYTVGATLRLSADWEVSGYSGYVPRTKLRGDGSIPPALGGGEISIDATQYFFGVAFARTFGK